MQVVQHNNSSIKSQPLLPRTATADDNIIQATERADPGLPHLTCKHFPSWFGGALQTYCILFMFPPAYT